MENCVWVNEMHWMFSYRSSRILRPWCSSCWPHQDNSPWVHTNMRQSVCTHICIQHTREASTEEEHFILLLSSCSCDCLHVSTVSELEQRTKEKMEAAKKRTSQEIAELKDKLKASRENINHLKSEIRKLEEDGDHKEHWEMDKHSSWKKQIHMLWSTL